VLDAQMAETYALREGLRLAQQLGCSTVIVKSDCLEVGNFLAMASAPIFYECYNLWREFAEISIEHCDKESNQVAHELARQAFMSKASCIWVDEPPNCIIPLISNDVTMFSDE
jgi:ribonuclease HI